MKKWLSTLILSLAPFLVHAGGDLSAQQQRQLEFTQRSQAAVKELGRQLKSELITAIQQGGPVNAIGVCNIRAPEIAEQLSAQSGLTVGRTALKVRNPNNSPDAWETAVMQSFEQSLKNGTDVNALQLTEQVGSNNNAPVLRYMRAIATQDVCVMCHGPREQLDPALRARLDELYPADQAVGFEAGALRGAFTVVDNTTQKD